MLTDDVWLLWTLVSGIAAIGLYWGGCALVNVLLDRATVVHPRTPGVR